jgi:hypothetical protein
MFAHAGKDVIDHLSGNVQGITLDKDARAPRMHECETCIQSKSAAQVSRRASDDHATRPFYRIVVDLVQLIPTGETCYNGDRYLLHAVCEYSKWHEAMTLANKSLPVVIAALKALLHKIERQYGYTVIVLKVDGDRGYGLELYRIARQAGLKIELRAPDTPEQLGAAEQAGNIITGKRTRKPPDHALATYYRAFAVAMNPTAPSKLAGEIAKLRLYCDQLPDPLKQ